MLQLCSLFMRQIIKQRGRWTWTLQWRGEGEPIMCGPAGFPPNIWPDHEIYKYGFARNLPWMFTHAGSPEKFKNCNFYPLCWIVGNWDFLEDVYRGSDISFGLGAIWWYVLHILHARLSLEPLLVHRQRKKFQNIASADHCGTGICWYIQPDHVLLNAFQLNGPWPWFWQCSVGKISFQALLHIFISWGPSWTLNKTDWCSSGSQFHTLSKLNLGWLWLFHNTIPEMCYLCNNAVQFI